MSDKPLVQQALAQDLANLTLDVRPKSKTAAGRVERFRAAMCYLRGFWEAVVREWSGLDRLRWVSVALSGEIKRRTDHRRTDSQTGSTSFTS